mgnify:CR=1 FL=1|jgi:hypothetical protein
MAVKKTEKKVQISERDEVYFKQGVLIAQNVIWLIMEYLFMEWETPIKFSIIRIIYFFFLTIGRIEYSNDPEDELMDPSKGDGLIFTMNAWMTLRYFINDFIAMNVLLWVFGRSIM